jgi:hypothetical protein
MTANAAKPKGRWKRPKLKIICLTLIKRTDRQFVFERTFPGLWNQPVQFFPAVDGDAIPDWKMDAIRNRHGMPDLRKSTWAVRLSKRLVLRDFLKSASEVLLFMEDDCLLLPSFPADIEMLLREMAAHWDMAFLGGQLTEAVKEDAGQGVAVRPFPPTALNHCVLFSRAGAAKVLKELSHPKDHPNSDEQLRAAVKAGRLNVWWTGRFSAVQRTSVSDNSAAEDGSRFGRTTLEDYGSKLGKDDLWLLAASVLPGNSVVTWGAGATTALLASQVGESGHVWAYEHEQEAQVTITALIERHELADRVSVNFVPPNPLRAEDQGLPRLMPEQMKNYVLAPLAETPPNSVDVVYIAGQERMRCLPVAKELLRPGGFLLIQSFWGTARYREHMPELLDWADCFCSTPQGVRGETETDLVLFQKRDVLLGQETESFATSEAIIAEGNSIPSELSVVTLWRPGWTPTQAAVMAWLQNERWPRDTCFYWSAAADSQTAGVLESAIQQFAAGCDYKFEITLVPGENVKSTLQKHVLVGALYTEIVAKVNTPLLLMVEDDNIPQPGAWPRMKKCFHNVPATTGAVMGAYRSRQRCDQVCARQGGNYIPWPSVSETGLLEAEWIGGGFTLYKTERIQACLPFDPNIKSGRLAGGWDRVLSKKMKKQGDQLFVDASNRVAHACPEVLDWCEHSLEPIA